MPTGKIVLIGLSGNTFEILEAARDQYEVAAILSDNREHGPQVEGIPVLPLSKAGGISDASFCCLIGSEKSFRNRGKLIAGLGLPLAQFATIVHARALVSRTARIGAGSVLYPGAMVLANAVLGAHVMLLANTVVHHDTEIGAHSIIGSNVTVAGHVRIGESCYIGSAASLRNGITVGAGALIGMGANVVGDVPAGAVMVGNPARVLRYT